MKPEFLLPILVLEFISCNTHSVTETPTIQLNDIVLNSSKLNMESAAEQAVQIRSLLSDGTGTRGASNISVLDVKPMTQAATRNGTSTTDTLVYIVNFEDDNGYVILSADQTTYPILSLSDTGNFEIDSLSENPTAAFIYSSMSDAITSNSSTIVDTIAGDDNAWHNPVFRYGAWTISSKVSPLTQVEWGQRYPYNTKLDLIDDQLPPIGCVATAMMQIMSVHEKPTLYSWDEMIIPTSSSYAIDALSTLAKDVGREVDMDYALDGSGAPTANVPDAMRYFGYTSGEVEDYSRYSVIAELKEYRPIYISGFLKR